MPARRDAGADVRLGLDDRAIAALEPLAEPGSKTLYLSMTFGWIIGELVRRTDPGHRSLGRFIREEIAAAAGHHGPVGRNPGFGRAARCDADRRHAANSLGVPAAAVSGIDAAAGRAHARSCSSGRTVRRAEVAGVGGIFNARSEARFWAMLANGASWTVFGCCRVSSCETLNTPRANSDEPRPGDVQHSAADQHRRVLARGAPTRPCARRGVPRAVSPGTGRLHRLGGPGRDVAVAICHNRLFNASTPEEDPILPLRTPCVQRLGSSRAQQRYPRRCSRALARWTRCARQAAAGDGALCMGWLKS